MVQYSLVDKRCAVQRRKVRSLYTAMAQIYVIPAPQPLSLQLVIMATNVDFHIGLAILLTTFTRTWGTTTGHHVGHQEVGRCHTRGESQETYTTYAFAKCE